MSITVKPSAGSVEFAFARVWSRQGQRPIEADWRRIDTQRSLSQALDVARSTALQTWLEGIARDSDGHTIEAALRRRWPVVVREVSSWMPEVWQPAVQWCAIWLDLPGLHHLARGGEPPAWMAEDSDWQSLIERRREPDALFGSRWSALSSLWRARDAVADDWVDAWWQAWRRRVPARELAPERPLTRWLELMRRHGVRFASAPVHEAWPLRAALSVRLLALLRHAGVSPAVVFVHLTQQALELERLRAELLRRALFPRWASA